MKRTESVVRAAQGRGAKKFLAISTVETTDEVAGLNACNFRSADPVIATALFDRLRSIVPGKMVLVRQHRSGLRTPVPTLAKAAFARLQGTLGSFLVVR